MNGEFEMEQGRAAALAKLREDFPQHQISQLPKPTKAQNEAVKADFKKGIRCGICKGWHHPDVIHLDYVGHAAATDRLLDTDIEWTWEPLAVDQKGLPAFDENGGLWIKLTVQGVTRLGYGSADGKSGGDAKKEIIGDAIRNAGMRFGMALDLWHKGDLHLDEGEDAKPEVPIDDAQFAELTTLSEQSRADTKAFCNHFGINAVKMLPASRFAEARTLLNKKLNKAQKSEAPEIIANEIPY